MIGWTARLVRSDGALAASSNGVKSLGRLAATIVVARIGGVDAVGLLTITIAIEAILISTLNAMFASPAAVLCPGRRRSLRAIIHTEAERMQLVSGVVLAAGTAIAGLVAGLDPVLSIILAAYLSLAITYQARRSTRLTEFRSGRVFAAELLIAVLGLAGPLAALLFELDPVALFWSAQAAAHLIGIIWLPSAARSAAPAPRATRIAQGMLLTTGRAMVMGSLANSLSLRSHAFLISFLLGREAVGLFGAASTFAAPIRMLSGALRGVMLPRFAQRQRSGGELNRDRRVMLAALLGVAASAWVADLLAPLMIGVVYGSEFEGAAVLVPLCVVLALLAMMSSIVACTRQAAGESGAVARIRVVCALVTPVLFGFGLMTGGLAYGLSWCIIAELACLLVLWSPRSGKVRARGRQDRPLQPALR
ncbi:MAG: hypothetical protein AAGG07_12780 [Planctomycetota bacterium]